MHQALLPCTATTASSSPALTSKTAPRVPTYYPPSEDVAGYLVTRDANRIWQVAPRLSEHQFKRSTACTSIERGSGTAAKTVDHSSTITNTSRLRCQDWRASFGETHPKANGVRA